MDINVSSYHFLAGSELGQKKTGLFRVPEKIESDTESRDERENKQSMEYPHSSMKDLNHHVCKICSRKFGCGRALGGHMRIHGSYDSVLQQRHKKRKVSEIGSTRYDYRDIMGHVGREESCVDSGNNSEIEEQVMDQYGNYYYPTASKSGSLRSKSSGFFSKADEEVASCLMMLAEGSWRPTKSKNLRDNDNSSSDIFAAEKKSSYECRTCKKVFSSHQALGGHRASHKKVKHSHLEKEMNTGSESCHTSNNNDQVSDESVHVQKVHECDVCHRNFGSGQALGGHKRCHGVINDGDSYTTCAVRIPSPKPSPEKPMFLLDLNKPAPLEEDEDNDHVDFYNLPKCDNNVSYYSQPQWWMDNPYRVYPLPQVATKTA